MERSFTHVLFNPQIFMSSLRVCFFLLLLLSLCSGISTRARESDGLVILLSGELSWCLCLPGSGRQTLCCSPVSYCSFISSLHSTAERGRGEREREGMRETPSGTRACGEQNLKCPVWITTSREVDRIPCEL